MSVVKSYSDARKELERIASQRKHFLSNSRSVREDIINPHSPQRGTSNTNNGNGRTFIEKYSTTNTGNPSNRFSGSTPMSASQGYNSSNRNNQSARTSSSVFSPSPSEFARSAGRSDRMNSPYSPPISQPYFQNATSSPGFGTASSVIGAFRQLQTKSRKVEQERADAMRERLDGSIHFLLLINCSLSKLFCSAQYYTELHRSGVFTLVFTTCFTCLIPDLNNFCSSGGRHVCFILLE